MGVGEGPVVKAGTMLRFFILKSMQSLVDQKARGSALAVIC